MFQTLLTGAAALATVLLIAIFVALCFYSPWVLVWFIPLYFCFKWAWREPRTSLDDDYEDEEDDDL